MSDDRFKQARRSLIDRHNQRQQQGGWDDSFEGDDFEDEATALVNLDGQPAFAPPPNFSDDEETDDARTEMIRIDQATGEAPPSGGVQMRSHSGIQPSYDSFGGPGGGQQGQFEQPAGQFGGPNHDAAATQGVPLDQIQPVPQGHGGPGMGHGGPGHGGPGHGGPGMGHSEPAFGSGQPGPDPNQSLVIGGGDAVDFEENTAFININSFAQGGEHFTPDDTSAGYEGNTQFVNIAALQASGPPGATPVEHDQILKESYQFGPQSIEQHEFTLVFAQNLQGQPVVLKRIWEGDPNSMPMPVRQRIAALDQVRHPRLVTLNGMIAAPSGAWVELSRPPGNRLTEILNGNGPQDPQMVDHWVNQIADILHVIHAQAFVYANLTTDAIWVQEDGSIVLEPFDVLSYEARGNLGVFGPPELNFPPDQQQLSPATDVYSLAAVTVAALTGLPLNLGAIEALDKKMQAAVMAALNQDPAARPVDAAAFVGALKGKRGALKGGSKSGGTNKLKIILPIVAVLGCVVIAAGFLMQPEPEKTRPMPPPGTNGMVAGMNNGTTTLAPGTIAGMTTGTTGATPVPVAVALDGVEEDPRLQIRTSLKLNPPTNDSNEPSPEDLEEAVARREEARKAMSDLDNLAKDAQRARYESAMQNLAKAVRLSKGMTKADEELFQELSKVQFVNEIRGDFYKRLDDSLKEARISRVKQVYPQLAGVDAEATEMQFFESNRSVTIKSIDPVETGEED